MVKIENFNLKYLFVFLLGFLVGLLIGHHSVVYAADSDFYSIPESENNMVDFVSLNDLLSDTTSVNFSVEQLDYLKGVCDNTLLVSHFLGDIGWKGTSIDVYCVPDTVSIVPRTHSDKSFSFTFSGPVGSEIDYYTFYNVDGCYSKNGMRCLNTITLGESEFVKSYTDNNSVLAVYDISDYYDNDLVMPSYFLNRSFKEVGFISSFISSVNGFMGYIVLMLCLFILLYIINKKFDLGLNLKDFGGGKPL